jgi:hypothetical protein
MTSVIVAKFNLKKSDHTVVIEKNSYTSGRIDYELSIEEVKDASLILNTTLDHIFPVGNCVELKTILIAEYPASKEVNDIVRGIIFMHQYDLVETLSF